MSKNTADFDDKMTELYRQYLEHCKEEGIKHPATPARFAQAVHEQGVRIMAHKSAEKAMEGPADSEVIYIATRVVDLQNPIGNSSMVSCSQCGESVWVDKEMREYREKSARIICTRCLPEITGRSVKDIAKEQLEDLDT